MPARGRLRAVDGAALVLALGLAVGGNRPSALAAPSTFHIVGGGYGHGIGMSQYGAHGMALRGATAGRIISFYYGGAAARPATLPATIRVGLLQAGRDPSTGGRLGRDLVRHLVGLRDADVLVHQLFNTDRKASCGTSTLPTCFIRFLPSF